MKNKGHVDFDFDKTLHVRHSWDNIWTFGTPIPDGIELVQRHLRKGHKIKILTARNEKQFPLVQDWLVKQGLPRLECTNIKDSRMNLLYDDKAVGLIENTGVTHIEIIKRLLSAGSFARDAEVLALAESAIRQWEKQSE